MNIELTEFPSEGNLLFGADGLIAEEDHFMLEQQSAQFVAQRRSQRLAQIDAGDFRADGGFQAGDPQCFGGV
jgi:hypothetical protein